MTFEEAIELLDNVEEAETRDFTDQFGRIDVDSLEIENYRLWAKEVHKVISTLQETYAPKIKMTGKELDFLNSRFKTNDSSGSKVFIDANGRKIEIIPRNLQAWLHPELIEVTDD